MRRPGSGASAADRSRDISPRTTFQSCGSSSTESRRRMRPALVIRESPFVDREAGTLVLGADHHRAKLQELEVDAVPADAGLPVEHRAAILELDRQRRRARAAGS